MTITVAIPTYNRASYLPATLASVFAQVRPPDHILIVDDGSTDNTPEVLEAYRDRIEVIRKENQGLSEARNTAQAQVRTDAVIYLDSDDLLLPDALRELEQALEARPDAVLAYCQAQLIDLEGNLVSALWDIDDAADDMWLRLLRGNCLRSAGAVLIRMSALNRVEPWDREMRGSEDWDMWLRLAALGPFARVARPLFQYRVHHSSISSDKAFMRRGGLLLYEKHLERHAEAARRYSMIRFHYDGCFPAPPDLTDAAPEVPVPDARVWPQLTASAGQNGTEGAAAPPPRPASPRHRVLRGALEGAGIAPLYRKTPLKLRLALRRMFGVDVNAL